MDCMNCGIEFEGRKDAKFCSPKCRVTFNRKQGIVTDNVTLSEPDVTDNFEFTIKHVTFNKKDDDILVAKSRVRKAKYWYDVPLAALPVIQKGWPKMPDDINGRQYFLWWKNEFKVDEDGKPIILNPFPIYDKVEYVSAGEGSRRWGA